MEKIIIPDVEIAFGDIPEKPFATQKKIIQLDESGILFDSQVYKWSSLTNVEAKFFLGNPYIQLVFNDKVELSLWFRSKWYKLRKRPWYATSEQLTYDFIEKVSERYQSATLREKISADILSQPPISTLGNLSQQIPNLIFILLPITALFLLIAFAWWVITNPGGVFEL